MPPGNGRRVVAEGEVHVGAESTVAELHARRVHHAGAVGGRHHELARVLVGGTVVDPLLNDSRRGGAVLARAGPIRLRVVGVHHERPHASLIIRTNFHPHQVGRQVVVGTISAVRRRVAGAGLGAGPVQAAHRRVHAVGGAGVGRGVRRRRSVGAREVRVVPSGRGAGQR